MTFPSHASSNMADFFDSYVGELAKAYASVCRQQLDAAQTLLGQTIRRDGQIWSAGNGGSAAIANHLVCDHSRGISCDTGLRPRVHSLSSTVEIITAIANDVAYSEIFVHQLALMARPGDVLLSISSSGDSENIVRACQWAKANGMSVIAMTGFAGGRSRHLADISLHVAADNYGVVEDVHQTLMHALAQFVRMSHMPTDLVSQRKF